MQRPRDAEVGDLGIAVGGEEDVGRLDVAMDDSLRVRVRQAAQQIGGDAESLVERERARAAKSGQQSLAVDVLGGQERHEIAVVADFVQRDHVRMLHGAAQLGLALQAFVELGAVLFVLELRLEMHGLERHAPADAPVPRQKDLANRSLAEERLDLVIAVVLRHWALEYLCCAQQRSNAARPRSRRARWPATTALSASRKRRYSGRRWRSVRGRG